MKIVRPTQPPSQTIIVDTIVAGEVQLEVTPSHPLLDRIDIVYASNAVVGIVNGAPSQVPTPPALPTGMRELARIYVVRNVGAIHSHNIGES